MKLMNLFKDVFAFLFILKLVRKWWLFPIGSKWNLYRMNFSLFRPTPWQAKLIFKNKEYMNVTVVSHWVTALRFLSPKTQNIDLIQLWGWSSVIWNYNHIDPYGINATHTSYVYKGFLPSFLPILSTANCQVLNTRTTNRNEIWFLSLRSICQVGEKDR